MPASTTSPPSASSTSSRTRGERAIGLATAGNLAVSQSVVSLVTEGCKDPETGAVETLMNVPTMFRAAQLVGRAIREVHRIDGESLEAQAEPASTCRCCSAARSRATACACS